ncbi:MAG TPA: M20/M25/M40 family metallo-hydrolase [Propionibacteriaceae bacterium]|nr:M20/M25/M40 family metallo-hydrolase [Propionibacteriaceae bacterium]
MTTTRDQASNPAGEVVRLTSELIRIDTSNYGGGESKGEREAAEYLAQQLDEVGIASELYESEPRRTTLVARWEPEGCDTSLPPLLLHGHTDVVPAIASDWQHDPFSGEVIDENVYGRGAVDMKDFDAMLLSVVRDRVRTNRPPRRPIRLVFTADEEAGCVLGATWLVNNHPETVNDCTEAIGEVGGFSLTVPGKNNGDDARLYLVQVAEKGLAWLRLISEAPAGHGSMRHKDNAVVSLAQAVSRIGEYQWPHRLHPAQQGFLDAVSEALDIEIQADSVEETLARLGSIARMVGAGMSNTANPTMLKAGYKTNVIPAQATAEVDCRYIPGLREEALATIKQLVGERIRVETTVEVPAVETEFSGALVEAMKASLDREDPGARAVPYLMSGGTDAKGWQALGIRCFGFTPLKLPPELDFVGLFHGKDERVPVDSLEFGCRVLDDLLDRA